MITWYLYDYMITWSHDYMITWLHGYMIASLYDISVTLWYLYDYMISLRLHTMYMMIWYSYILATYTPHLYVYSLRHLHDCVSHPTTSTDTRKHWEADDTKGSQPRLVDFSDTYREFSSLRDLDTRTSEASHYLFTLMTHTTCTWMDNYQQTIYLYQYQC